MDCTEEERNAFPVERSLMVDKQIAARGVRDERVLSVMRNTPRHLFVPRVQWLDAYKDCALPIACEQTISQPYMVAAMTEMLRIAPGAKILEIGTGSGYQAAVLAQLAGTVVTIERHPALAREACALLESLGCTNVRVIADDGSPGFPEEAPYDGIVVTAGAPTVPPSLPAQLAEGGRLVVPVGNEKIQDIVTIVRRGDLYEQEHGMACRFVPLIGKQGWREGHLFIT